MNKIISVISTLLCVLITPITFAHSNGDIIFHGAIIEAPQCQTTQVKKQIQLDCSMHNTTLSESDIVFDSQLEHLDQEKNRSVMHITYH